MKEIFYNFAGYNQKIFLWINSWAINDDISYAAKIISKFFDIEMFALYYCFAAIYLMVRLKFIENSKRYDAYCKKYDFMVRLGIAYALFGFVYAILKFTINMPRPFCSLSHDQFITILDVTQERCLSSFPSSHAGLVFLITLSFWREVDKFQKLLLCSLVILVSFSRVLLAMHYPADILYGLIVAYCVYLLAYFVFFILKDNLLSCVKSKIWSFLYK
ncbi:MAG: hypothetical protein RLZZ59_6 [Pseudomonadota bacterium]|jgi:membrane-associated phospholipid phosphatase